MGSEGERKQTKLSKMAENLPNSTALFVYNSDAAKSKFLIKKSHSLMDKKVLTKTYRLIKSDNYDAFLKEAGASLHRRRLAQKERPTIQLRRYDNEYTLNTASEHQVKTLKFRPNEKFVQKGFDDKNVQTFMSFENGNTLVEMQMGQKPVTILREFFVNGIIEMMMCEKAVCCRVYSSSE